MKLEEAIERVQVWEGVNRSASSRLAANSLTGM